MTPEEVDAVLGGSPGYYKREGGPPQVAPQPGPPRTAENRTQRHDEIWASDEGFIVVNFREDGAVGTAVYLETRKQPLLDLVLKVFGW